MTRRHIPKHPVAIALAIFAVNLIACALYPSYEPVPMPVEPAPPTVDVSGRWVGLSLEQRGVRGIGNSGLVTSETPVILVMSQEKGVVAGFMRISDLFATSSALAEVEGVVSGDALHLEGVRFASERNDDFCLSSTVLRHVKDDMGERLAGEFFRSRHPDACSSDTRGYFVLERVPAQSRIGTRP